MLHPAEEEGAEGYVLSLIRFNATTQSSTEVDSKNPILCSVALPFQVGTWHHLHFANIDNHLVFELDHGAFREVIAYEKNEARQQTGVSKHLRADRVGFGGETCRARFRGIRVLRDRYYTNAGRYAVQPDPPSPDAHPLVNLGPGYYFVLGDNSAISQDSRIFGDVPAADIVGRPVAVVWPLDRRRWL